MPPFVSNLYDFPAFTYCTWISTSSLYTVPLIYPSFTFPLSDGSEVVDSLFIVPITVLAGGPVIFFIFPDSAYSSLYVTLFIIYPLSSGAFTYQADLLTLGDTEVSLYEYSVPITLPTALLIITGF